MYENENNLFEYAVTAKMSCKTNMWFIIRNTQMIEWINREVSSTEHYFDGQIQCISNWCTHEKTNVNKHI